MSEEQSTSYAKFEPRKVKKAALECIADIHLTHLEEVFEYYSQKVEEWNRHIDKKNNRILTKLFGWWRINENKFEKLEKDFALNTDNYEKVKAHVMDEAARASKMKGENLGLLFFSDECSKMGFCFIRSGKWLRRAEKLVKMADECGDEPIILSMEDANNIF